MLEVAVSTYILATQEGIELGLIWYSNIWVRMSSAALLWMVSRAFYSCGITANSIQVPKVSSVAQRPRTLVLPSQFLSVQALSVAS